MKSVVKRGICCFLFLCLIQISSGAGSAVVKDGDALLSFSTGGHMVYHLQCADIGANATTIVGPCYDGVELVMAIEEEFKLSLANSEVEKTDTVGVMVDLVYSKLRHGSEESCPSQHGFYVVRKLMILEFNDYAIA